MCSACCRLRSGHRSSGAWRARLALHRWSRPGSAGWSRGPMRSHRCSRRMTSGTGSVLRCRHSAAEKPGLWQSLALWRWMTLATGALAAACLAALIVFVSQPTQPPLIAAIQANGQSHFVATIDPGRSTVSVLPAAFAADASRVPELWLIAPGDRPRSLGLLRADTDGQPADPRKPAAARDPPVHACGLARAAGRIPHRRAHRPRHCDRAADLALKNCPAICIRPPRGVRSS